MYDCVYSSDSFLKQSGCFAYYLATLFCNFISLMKIAEQPSKFFLAGVVTNQMSHPRHTALFAYM